MAEQAKDGMKSYLEFCGKECDNEDVPNENLNPDEPKSSVSEDTNDFQDALSEASIAGKYKHWEILTMLQCAGL